MDFYENVFYFTAGKYFYTEIVLNQGNDFRKMIE